MYTGQFRIIEGGSGSVEQKKSSLRAYMKRRRGENENRDVKENGLVENFFSTRAMEKESFFVYLSYSSEAPTDKLISRLLKAGKTVYAPRVEGRDMEAVLFGEDFTLSERGRTGRKAGLRRRILRPFSSEASRNARRRLLFRFPARARGSVRTAR